MLTIVGGGKAAGANATAACTYREEIIVVTLAVG